MLHADQAFGENGERIQVADFPYDLIDSVTETATETEQLSQREIDAALALQRTLLAWIWQSGPSNMDGVKIRAIVSCWIFLKPLRPMSLTELAVGCGMDKQSLGRWVENFKLMFPHIRIAHMRTTE